MRTNPTKAEAAARELLRPLGFQFQVCVTTPRHRSAGATDGWILDCYHPVHRLCIELDGGVHAKTKGRDGRRDRALAAIGIRTIRFVNSVVFKSPALFTARVAEAMRCN